MGKALRGWPKVWPAMPSSESTLPPKGNWGDGWEVAPVASAVSLVAGLGEEQLVNRTPVRANSVAEATGKEKEEGIVAKK